jgi:endonuclease YncB( thermonuclease family)
MSKLYLLASLLFLALFPQLAFSAETKIVIRVISGDTIVVDGGQAVRIIGTLAPQENEYYAKESRQFLINQLLAQEVELSDDNLNASIAHKDEYGRRLAYVSRTSDKLFINGELLKKGYCFYSPKYAQRRATDLLIFEQNARKNKIGLWEKTLLSPQQQAELDNRTYKEPSFELKPGMEKPDIRVQIIWAKKANPKFKIGRSADEVEFLTLIYQNQEVSDGKVPLLVQIRKNFAEALNKYYQDKNIPLTIEASGDLAETLRFIAEGMDQSDADKFCSEPINKELFSSLEFKEVVFLDGKLFSFTYKVEQ